MDNIEYKKRYFVIYWTMNLIDVEWTGQASLLFAVNELQLPVID